MEYTVAMEEKATLLAGRRGMMLSVDQIHPKLHRGSRDAGTRISLRGCGIRKRYQMSLDTWDIEEKILGL
jgi:hypothetical protein